MISDVVFRSLYEITFGYIVQKELNFLEGVFVAEYTYCFPEQSLLALSSLALVSVTIWTTKQYTMSDSIQMEAYKLINRDQKCLIQ